MFAAGKERYCVFVMFPPFLIINSHVDEDFRYETIGAHMVLDFILFFVDTK